MHLLKRKGFLIMLDILFDFLSTISEIIRLIKIEASTSYTVFLAPYKIKKINHNSGNTRK